MTEREGEGEDKPARTRSRAVLIVALATVGLLLVMGAIRPAGDQRESAAADHQHQVAHTTKPRDDRYDPTAAEPNEAREDAAIEDAIAQLEAHPRFEDLLEELNLTHADYAALSREARYDLAQCVALGQRVENGVIDPEEAREALQTLFSDMAPELKERFPPELVKAVENTPEGCQEAGPTQSERASQSTIATQQDEEATRTRSGTTPWVSSFVPTSHTNLDCDLRWWVNVDNTARIDWVRISIDGVGTRTFNIDGGWNGDSGRLRMHYEYPDDYIGCGEKTATVTVRWNGRWWNDHHHRDYDSGSCSDWGVGRCPKTCDCCGGPHCSQSCDCNDWWLFVWWYSVNCDCTWWTWAGGWEVDGYWSVDTIDTRTIRFDDVIDPAQPSPTADPSGWTRDPVDIEGYTVHDNEIVPTSSYCLGVEGYQYQIRNNWAESPSWTGVALAPSTPPLTLNPTHNLETGEYVVRLRAYDYEVPAHGGPNYGSWGYTSMKVDNTPPDAPQITELDCGGQWLDSTVPTTSDQFPDWCNLDNTPRFRWSKPSDYGAGVDHYQYKIYGVARADPSTVVWETTWTNINDDSATVTFHYTAGLPDHWNYADTYGQQYYFAFRTVDEVGWHSDSVYVSLSIDHENTQPRVHAFTQTYTIDEDGARDYGTTFDLALGPAGYWDLDDQDWWSNYIANGADESDHGDDDGVFFDNDPTETGLEYSWLGEDHIAVFYDPTSHRVRFEAATPNWYGAETITFTATDHHPQSDHPHSVSADVTIVVDEVNDDPYVELRAPPDGGTVVTTTPTLSWVGYDLDEPIPPGDYTHADRQLSYRLFIDDAPMDAGEQPPSSARYYREIGPLPKGTIVDYDLAAEGITLNESQLYYWKVVAYDDPSRGGVYEDAVPWSFATPSSPKPDLAIVAIDPRSALVGETVEFVATIQNVGEIDIADPATGAHGPIQVEWSLDGGATTHTTLINEAVPTHGFVYVQWSHPTLDVGSHTVDIRVDTTDEVEELIELGAGGSNNRRSAEIEVIDEPLYQTPAFVPPIALVALSMLGCALLAALATRRRAHARYKGGRKMEKNEKAVSPIIGAILIIAITILLAGTVFVWVGGYLDTTKTAIPSLAAEVETDAEADAYKVVVTGVDGPVPTITSVHYQLQTADGEPLNAPTPVSEIYWRSQISHNVTFFDLDRNGRIDTNDYFLIHRDHAPGGSLLLTFPSTGDIVLGITLE